MAKHNPLATDVDYDKLVEIATNIQEILPEELKHPTIGVICGSGLGGLADDLDADKPKKTVSYDSIGFQKPSVHGHAGQLVFGYISGKPSVCMQGRLHFYEGHHASEISKPVRVMKLLGIKILVVTNAAGGLNDKFNCGDIMLMKDHINLAGMCGHNPLMGPNDSRIGTRFPPMNKAYDEELRDLAKQVAQKLCFDNFFHEGVYVHVTGPNYETPSESIFLKVCGADAVGMSTAPEVVVATHAGIRVLGFSLITNVVITEHDSKKPPPNHQEVMETADRRAKDLLQLVKSIIGRMST